MCERKLHQKGGGKKRSTSAQVVARFIPRGGGPRTVTDAVNERTATRHGVDPTTVLDPAWRSQCLPYKRAVFRGAQSAGSETSASFRCRPKLPPPATIHRPPPCSSTWDSHPGVELLYAQSSSAPWTKCDQTSANQSQQLTSALLERSQCLPRYYCRTTVSCLS